MVDLVRHLLVFVVLQAQCAAATSASAREATKLALHRHGPETAGEKEEERLLKGKPERMAIYGAVGGPHEGMGLETSVPLTISEDTIEKDHAEYSVHAIAEHIVVPGTGIFIFCIMMGNVLSNWRFTKMIPDSAATVFFSVSLGLGLRQLMNSGFITMEHFTIMSSTTLNLVLLPIILFNSGWTLRTGDFMSQFEYILIFAILGTLISTGFIGYASYTLANTFGLHSLTGLRENFVFAALISATDPVATLSTYGQLRIEDKNPLLNTLVFGEAAINDAVAIVLFNVINTMPLGEVRASEAGLEVVWLLCGSIVFGVLVAAALVLAMRLISLPSAAAGRTTYLFVSAYFIFALAETVELSGIIANLFAGVVFKKYGARHFTREDDEHSAGEYLELSAHMGDTAVFILCGASTALMNSRRGLVFGCLAIGLCLVGRGMSVSICGALANGLKKLQEDPTVITAKHQFMMWHGGLRGGIALVLALEIDATWCQHKATILNATFFIICVFLLVFGSTTELCLQKLDMMGEDGQKPPPIDSAWRRTYHAFFERLDSGLAHVLVGTGKGREAEEELDTTAAPA